MKKATTSYEDLLKRKQSLKDKIEEQEQEFKNNKLIKLSSFVLNGESVKQPLFDSMSSINLQGIMSSPIANILSSFLMSNKIARKYFISFTILKEMVPFAIDKIKDIMNHNAINEKKTTL